jgi:hypothetical protein
MTIRGNAGERRAEPEVYARCCKSIAPGIAIDRITGCSKIL